MKHTYHAIAALTLAALLGALPACGGSSGEVPETAASAALPTAGGLDWQGAASAGGYHAIAREADMRTTAALADTLTLAVDSADGGEVVRLGAGYNQPGDRALLQLAYDASRVSPVDVQLAPGLAECCLVLGAVRAPGVYSLAIVATGLEPVLSGNQPLASVRFAPADGRSVSQAMPRPGITAAAEVTFSSSEPDVLEWSYRSAGDYDQSSEVNVADLVPIGQYYLATEGASIWPKAKVADGDSNGEVNSSDLATIGANLLRTVHGYQLMQGLAEDGPWISTAVQIPFSEGTVPPTGSFKRFAHKVAGATDERWYAVAPYFEDIVAGSRSNGAQYGVETENRPPRNVYVQYNGTEIMLSWDQPEGQLPESYSVYASFGMSMPSVWKLNSEPVGETHYGLGGVFSPETSLYLAVTARYDSGTSVYSTVVHYDGTWEKDPPIWLGGEPDGGIRSVKVGVDYAQIAWHPAADNTTPPVSYQLFWALSSEGIDWLSPGLTVSRTSTRIIAPLQPDTSYDFAVRAVDAVGNTTTNTNTLTAVTLSPQ